MADTKPGELTDECIKKLVDSSSKKLELREADKLETLLYTCQEEKIFSIDLTKLVESNPKSAVNVFDAYEFLLNTFGDKIDFRDLLIHLIEDPNLAETLVK